MIELGPESYLGRKTIMTELAKDIGLEQDIVTSTTGQSYIFAKNKLYPIPRRNQIHGNSDRYQTVL